MFDDIPEVAEAATAFGWEGVHADDYEDIRNHPWVAGLIGTPSSNRDDALDRPGS